MTQGAKRTLTDLAKIVTVIGCTLAMTAKIATWGTTITAYLIDLKKDINNSAQINETQTATIKMHEERLNRIEGKVDANAQKILDNEYDLTKIKYHVK